MTLTLKEISKLPKFAKPKAGSKYKIADNVYVDNIEGHGATRAHTEICVKGFVSTLPIDKVLSMMGQEEDQHEVEAIVAKITEGHGVAAPRIFLDIDNYMSFSKGRCKIADHDGYNTCVALSKLGLFEVTVQFPLLGYTMRNIEDRNDFLNKIAEGLESPSGTIFKDLINKTTV
jgi:hypothetical protein